MESNLEPGTVVRCDLRGGKGSFPANELLIVSFKTRQSESESFEWVTDTFKIAETAKDSNLILPCLGRNWVRTDSITFDAFFKEILKLIPAGGRANLYFSFYSQWPSFELENAVASLNSAWKQRP